MGEKEELRQRKIAQRKERADLRDRELAARRARIVKVEESQETYTIACPHVRSCTNEVIRRVAEGLRKGMTQSSAFERAGIPVSRGGVWLHKGRHALEEWDATGDLDASQAPYIALVRAVEKAQCEAEEKALDCVWGHVDDREHPGNLQAAQWLLERRFKYTKQAEVKLSARIDSREKVDFSNVSAEEAALRYKRLVAEVVDDGD